MRPSLVLLVLLLSASITYSSFVYGDIYENNLEKLNKTVISIEGGFSYQLVTDKANYSIFLPEGEYTISASATDSSGNALRAEERIKVGPEDQRIDLVLKPMMDVGQIAILAAFLLVVMVFLWSNRHWDMKPKPQPKMELDGDAKSVLKVLDGFEGRATQKELKETLKFSDAKLSLILTELEHMGKIKKFKRGRANIVRKL